VAVWPGDAPVGVTLDGCAGVGEPATAGVAAPGAAGAAVSGAGEVAVTALPQSQRPSKPAALVTRTGSLPSTALA